MIRIALVIGQLGLGGAEKQLCQLAAGLLQHNYQPLVISLSAGGEREKALRASGIETVVLSRNGSFDIKRLWEIAKVLRRFQPEIVYGFDYSGSIYGRLAGAIARVPILIGGLRSQWTPPRKVRYMERLLRFKTEVIISNSLAGKRAWMKLAAYPEEMIAVVPNGFDWTVMQHPPCKFQSLREWVGLKTEEPIVGCIGALYDLKNPLMFIDVAATLISRGTKAHFVWIGDGAMKNEVERIRDARGLREVVHLPGKHPDAQWLARDFQVGVLTSVIEGMPNVIAEYMFWGVPVVATNAGGCSELIEHQRSGFIVEKNDAVEMAAYVGKLLYDRTAAMRMGRRGQERLKKQFSAEAMLTGTMAVFEAARKRLRLRKADIRTPEFEQL